MKNGRDQNSCLFGEELVSYIYGELPADGTIVFEDHLLSCTNCIEEFAAVSESRLGVYEWYRDEFLPLETPVFAIPYRRPVVVTEPTLGWLDALRGLFSPARLAVAGGAFAILAFAFGTNFIVSTPTNQLIADANVSVPELTAGRPENVVLSSDAVKQTDLNETPVVEFKAERTNVRPTQPTPRLVQARAANKSVIRKEQVQVQATRPDAVPRLGTFEETEDTSLRLADLVADIDTYDF